MIRFCNLGKYTSKWSMYKIINLFSISNGVAESFTKLWPFLTVVLILFCFPWQWSKTCIWLCFLFNKKSWVYMWTVNFQMFKLALEKAEEPEIKLPTSVGSSKEQESSRKTSISALLTMPKPLTVWITTNCGKFWKRWEYQTTWPASWEACMQVRKQQLELDMEQQTCSK